MNLNGSIKCHPQKKHDYRLGLREQTYNQNQRQQYQLSKLGSLVTAGMFSNGHRPKRGWTPTGVRRCLNRLARYARESRAGSYCCTVRPLGLLALSTEYLQSRYGDDERHIMSNTHHLPTVGSPRQQAKNCVKPWLCNVKAFKASGSLIWEARNTRWFYTQDAPRTKSHKGKALVVSCSLGNGAGRLERVNE